MPWIRPGSGRPSLGSTRRPAATRAECEFASETDPAVLKVLLKVKPGLGEDYDWVECGACGAAWQVPYFPESVG